MHSIVYENNGKTAYFNGKRYCRDDKTGYYLHSLSNGKTGSRLHRDVYTYYKGEIPKGMHIHHIDHDKSNNEPDNLEMLSQTEHNARHLEEETTERKEARMDNWTNNYQKSAKEWHKSKQGKNWHKKHYESMKNKLYVQKEFKCLQCGKSFISTKVDSKFCCNNCKSKWRRENGVDDEQRECLICGKTFEVNKYSKKLCCNRSCGNKMRAITIKSRAI